MILWLASYPKSGNIFLRSLLTTYFFTRDGNFKFDVLKKSQQFPSSEVFAKIGVDINDKYKVSENYAKAQEEINKSNRLEFVKTHSSFCKMYNKFNFSDLKNSIGVIYIVRDPRNIVTSFAHHNSKTIEETYDLLINKMAVGNERGEPEVYMGSWSFNFNSWKIYQKSNKYHLVKYEDLISNTKDEFIKILKFINSLGSSQFPIFEEKLDKAIKTTSFYNMKKLEETYGFDEAKFNEDKGEKIPFFYLGPKNDWKKMLSLEIKQKIENSFEKEMLELKYL